MTKAEYYIKSFDNVTDLADTLDATGYPSEQDWDNEQTTWTLPDGSQLAASGEEVWLV